ncbi:transposable element Tcb2 transposase [Trichonephila clavipes]|nr:transposable element Tcb2 transposase [Trichonephila clavipes]
MELVFIQDTSMKEAYGLGSACFWRGISVGGRTDLHVFPRENVNAHIYRDDILDTYLRPYAGAIGDNFVLQHDNARPLTFRIVDAYRGCL